MGAAETGPSPGTEGWGVSSRAGGPPSGAGGALGVPVGEAPDGAFSSSVMVTVSAGVRCAAGTSGCSPVLGVGCPSCWGPSEGTGSSPFCSGFTILCKGPKECAAAITATRRPNRVAIVNTPIPNFFSGAWCREVGTACDHATS